MSSYLNSLQPFVILKKKNNCQSEDVFAKMSAKLVVQKFDTDTSFKYLNVTIEDGQAIFSEWQDSESRNSEKATEKSSHLIVKLVTEQDYDNLELEQCAKEIKSTNPFKDSGDNKSNDYVVMTMSKSEQDPSSPQSSTVDSKDDSQYSNLGDTSNPYLGCLNTVSPLEYSLERVKETNARIMQNIHMLNRTLNYAKKKEVLDIGCHKSSRSYTCNTCGKCFVYETGLRRHYSMRHSIVDVQPRWQVVWTCIECFQVWPAQNVALQHASQCCQTDSVDNIREIKTSSLLQCEFCEKVFTSIPRLLRHAKDHTTSNNYECNACEMAFLSYKSAEQHWLTCAWLKTCYTFYLPKLLLCNACDRKFRNYDQLYNHRYKVSHFMTKTQRNQSIMKSFGVLVYQCEICGQSFPSVTLLQTHRIHYHPRYESAIQTHDTSYQDSQTLNMLTDNENPHGLEDITDQQ